MISLTIHQISFLYISVQSFIFAVFLLVSGGPKRQSNFILTGLLLTLSIQMALMLAIQLYPNDSVAYPYISVFGFLYGPLLYLYTRSLIYEHSTLYFKDFWHGTPAAIMLFSAIFNVGLHSWLGSLLYLSMIIYTVISIRCIRHYQQIVRQTQSTESEINLSWLQWVLMIFTVTFLVDIYQHFYEGIDVIPGLSLVQISLILLVNGMFFWGLRQPIIFLGISSLDESVSLPLEITEPIKNSPNTTIDKVQRYMRSESPFKDPKLSLNSLARQLDLTPRELSILINQQLKQNFVDFVNTFRIELAKKRLLNPKDEKETIAEIMYEVGFKSKSVFNSAFKRKTGKTPSEFKKTRLT